MAKKKHPQKQNKQTNTLRIIGGDWRSRKLQFQDAPNLRPTPDRVRETLFNWLQGSIHGTHCLDLFAGSGALGLEALSRGAKEVIFVEKMTHVATQIEANLALLNADSPVINNDATSFLENTKQIFDIIFLDPPFRQDLLPTALKIILEKKRLNHNGLIYLEYESEEVYDWDNYGLSLLKETGAGQVKSCLLKRH
ncbi:MAG TPA: 16S rRNA (guanine(966)-N(2))-methyltransferase RsmD [Leucothrix mucor]|nr:16S rRNA (guanine(966)-N(2))-methyltransferase RsmD [Leucothrix mucor]